MIDEKEKEPTIEDLKLELSECKEDLEQEIDYLRAEIEIKDQEIEVLKNGDFLRNTVYLQVLRTASGYICKSEFDEGSERSSIEEAVGSFFVSCGRHYGFSILL